MWLKSPPLFTGQLFDLKITGLAYGQITSPANRFGQ